MRGGKIMSNTMTKEVDSSAKKNGGDNLFLDKVDVLNDKVAHVMFTDKAFHGYIKKLISMILDIDEKCIGKLELQGDHVNRSFDIKTSEADIVYESKDMYVNLEFNSFKNENVELKNNKYLFHIILNQIPIGEVEKKKDIKKSIQINFNSFDMYGREELVYRSHIMDDEYHEIRSDYLEIYDIDLALAKKMWYTNKEKKSLEYYLFAISCRDNYTKHKMYEGDYLMKKVVKGMDKLGKDFYEDLFYDKEELMKTVSFDEGIKQGIEQGKEEGKKENKVEIAKKMISLGETNEKIILYTELSLKEIEKLREDM